ncbi:MAG: aminoacyl-tRNA deacylase [Anaerolineae bacterium]|nr:aminoacyl-tRNA deacylase [Anaerolineae bacterium]
MSDAPIEKTNAMRALEQRRIVYQAVRYGDPDEFHTAVEVAEMLGQPVEHVYKTIVVLRERGKPLLVMVQADREIDLRRLAKATGDKKLQPATLKEAERLTGLQVGGISALALLNKGFEPVIDASALRLDRVYVSAGRRGMQLGLAVTDLIKVTGAKVVTATADEDGRDAAKV